MAGPGRGRVSRSPNTEMARDNHLTHNSPPRGESCPPWPALITRLWCFSLSHAHTCNKLGISVTDCVTKCYKSLSHSVVTALAVITLSSANTPCTQPGSARPRLYCVQWLYCTLCTMYCAYYTPSLQPHSQTTSDVYGGTHSQKSKFKPVLQIKDNHLPSLNVHLPSKLFVLCFLSELSPLAAPDWPGGCVREQLLCYCQPQPAQRERERATSQQTSPLLSSSHPPLLRLGCHTLYVFYQTQTAMDRILKSVTLLKSSEDSAAIYLLIIDF